MKGALILHSSQTPHPFIVNKKSIVIGREKSNSDLVIAHQSVSRNHCEIFYQKQKYYLRDLESSLGTFVNGRKIGDETCMLKEGDVLKVGPVEIKLQLNHESVKEKSSKQWQLIIATLGIVICVPFIISDKKEINEEAGNSSRDVASISDESVSLKESSYSTYKSSRYKSADIHFKNGLREFLVGNYWRALLEFESSLQIYPNHEMAKTYKEQTESKITQVGEEEYQDAYQLVQLMKYREAQARLVRARELLTLRERVKKNQDLIKGIDELMKFIDKQE